MRLLLVPVVFAGMLEAQPEQVWLGTMKESFQPVADTPGLPRVLIIGDSISIYYTLPVRNLLSGSANVHRIPENGGTSANGVAKIEAWLGTGKWDVIHFNFGLHDIVFRAGDKRNNIPLVDYEANLRKFVLGLKATGGRLIWASTTPAPATATVNPARSDADVVGYNDVARRIMQENGIEIDVLYRFAKPRLEWIQRPANVHYTFHGYDVLAVKVAASIRTMLRAPADDALDEVRRVLTSKEPATWVFTGDSITEAERHTMGGRSYVEHFHERVHSEMSRRLDAVINSGAGGTRIQTLRENRDRLVFRFQPTVVSLMFGMNDCVRGPSGRGGFRAELEEMVGAIRSRGAIPLLQTPNAICFPNAERCADLSAYVSIIREVAAKTKSPLIDHYAHWLEARTEQRLLYWLNDGSIHPNQFGHVEMAHEIFRKLGVYDAESYTCRLFVP